MVRAGRLSAGLPTQPRISYAEDSGSDESERSETPSPVFAKKQKQAAGRVPTLAQRKSIQGGGGLAKKKQRTDYIELTSDSEEDDMDVGYGRGPKGKKSPKKVAKQKTNNALPIARKSAPGGKKQPSKPVPRGGGSGRQSARASTAPKYAEDSDSDDFESYRSAVRAPSGVVKVSIKKKSPKVLHPPVSEMIPKAIRSLRDHPRKGSSLAAIKSFMVSEWNVQTSSIASKIKNYMLNALKDGEIIQVKGKGLNGRFTVPGLKIKKKKKKLTPKWDQEQEPEYKPTKTARDEERERAEEEKEVRRQQRKDEEARMAEEKAKAPKKPIVRRTEWEVEFIKAMKVVNDKTWYQVKFKNWAKPSWEPEEHLDGCRDVVENFLIEEKVRLAELEEKKRLEEEAGEFEVARILEVKFRGPKKEQREFLIRWKGHGEEMDSWEPEENLYCTELIDRFMKRYEDRLASSEKSLRVVPNKVQRLVWTGARSKRNPGYRISYAGMDE